MNELEKFQKVNEANNLKELADIIRSFAYKGIIQGRTRSFDSERMATFCESYTLEIHNHLTREYGIRQQAMMLAFYGENY